MNWSHAQPIFCTWQVNRQLLFWQIAAVQFSNQQLFTHQKPKSRVTNSQLAQRLSLPLYHRAVLPIFFAASYHFVEDFVKLKLCTTSACPFYFIHRICADDVSVSSEYQSWRIKTRHGLFVGVGGRGEGLAWTTDGSWTSELSVNEKTKTYQPCPETATLKHKGWRFQPGATLLIICCCCFLEHKQNQQLHFWLLQSIFWEAYFP